MKKFATTNFKHLLSCLLSISLFMSCTEKVSDDVKPENLSTKEKTKADYVNKAMRVVDKNRKDLSFMLHKAGSMSSPCELNAPTNGFSSATYDKTSKLYTADCILDAQEFDVFFHGVELQLQVDEYLCEYINYKPFRFLQYATGSSHKVQYQIECDGECGKNYGEFCNQKFKTMSSSPSFGKFDPSTLGTIFSDPILEEGGLSCEFDYSPIGPNCDPGYIRTINFKLESEEVLFGGCSDGSSVNKATCEGNGDEWKTETRAECTNQYGAGNFPLLSPLPSAKVECAGDKAACLNGPGAEEPGPEFTGTIFNNEDLKYFEHELKVEAPGNKDLKSNMYVANFSRICSSTGEPKTHAKYDTSLFNIIGHEVENMPDRNFFNSYSVDSDDNGTSDYTVSSHHAFKGSAASSKSTFNVQPYYAYECLDQARDIKAQIRIYVREWDKVFDPSNPYIARLSDINQANPLMDADGYQQVGEVWNDKEDWDDLLSDYDMNKSNGFQSMFLNDQCTSLIYGFCTNRAYTDEISCEAASEVWKIHPYCSNATFDNQTDCEGNGDTWNYLNKYQLYPGFSL